MILSQEIIARGLAVIVVIFFFIDNWRPAPTNKVPFHKTPRLQGFLFILGGGVLSALPSYLSKDPAFINYYLETVVISIVVIAISQILPGLVYAYNRLYEIYPWKAKHWIVVTSWPYVMLFMRDGWEKFHLALDTKVYDGLLTQQHNLSSFTRGIYNGMFSLKEQGVSTPEIYLDVTRNYLLTFVNIFLDRSTPNPNKYRASIFWKDPKTNEFKFVLGVSSGRAQHTGESLPSDCLAGDALESPGTVIWYPQDSKKRELRFYERNKHKPYETVIVCAISTDKTAHPIHIPSLVLCIDCIDKTPPVSNEYITEAVRMFSSILAHGQVLFDIKNKDIEAYFNNKV